MTTSYGKTIALDRNGHILWTYTPPGIDGWEGSAQITNASPAADPDGQHVYAVSPDGVVHKLNLADGSEVTGGGWPVTITRDPTHEKLGTALNISGRLVLATTGGYIGDAPPYQGHVVSIDRASGQIVHVWNALCSDRHEIIEPSSCPDSDAAIWARAGAVVEPETGRILVATGNAPYDGNTAWGDSVLELSPDAGRLLGSWTPPNQEELNSGDVDLGSTAPALVRGADGRLYGIQGGKDALLRVIDIERMQVVQTLPTPGAQSMFTTPAVWRQERVHRDGRGDGRLPADRKRHAPAPQHVDERHGRDEPGDRRRPRLRVRPVGRRHQPLPAGLAQPGRDAAGGGRPLAEPDRDRRPRARRRGRRERARDVGDAQPVPAAVSPASRLDTCAVKVVASATRATTRCPRGGGADDVRRASTRTVRRDHPYRRGLERGQDGDPDGMAAATRTGTPSLNGFATGEGSRDA